MPPGQIPDSDDLLLEDDSQLAPPFQAPDPRDFASAEVFVRNKFNLGNDGLEESERRHKQVTSKRDKLSKTEVNEDALLKKALREAEQQHEDQQKSTEASKETTAETTTVGSGCNPKVRKLQLYSSYIKPKVACCVSAT